MIFRGFRKDHIRLMGERGSALDLARGRLVLISAIFMLAYIMVAVRVIDLTIIQGELSPPRTELAVDETASLRKSVTRGDILDRNGILLATTLKMASLYADPQLISDPEVTAQGLAKIFPGLSYGEALQKLQSSKRFVWIQRNLTPVQQRAVLDLGQPGLAFQHEDTRLYPQGNLAAHLVGFTDIDSHGLAGIERSFDSYVGEGKPITLTLDVRLQHVLRREVTRAMEEFTAKGGTGVILDVTNGEILAGVSLPDFDPHNPGNASKDEIFNRLSLGVYELGSMFKIFSTAALLETHDPAMSMTFDASKPIKVGRFSINDYHAENRVLTIPEIFMVSSNIGSALMGQMVGTEALQDFYRDLGLLTPSKVEIGEVGAPLLPNPWRDVNTLTASFGHGIATSPLQMTTAAASIVNGGFFIKPKLVLDNTPEDKSEDLRILSEKTAHRMRQLLRLVVTDGTGKSANVPGYRVGGKTGTAEKIGAHGYDRKRLISSFIAVFPIEAPRYAVLIAIDEPKGNKKSFGFATGGWVAAPAVARVISSMGAILGLPAQQPASEDDLSASLLPYIHTKDEKVKKLVSH